MSSAILYVAIVAIWACVLIPRWLRRDAPRGAVSPIGAAIPGEARFSSAADSGGVVVEADSADDAELVVQPGEAVADTDTDEARRPAPEPMTAEESRRRMLAARRRLLIMLVVLEAAAVALATIGLAAMWVIAPPSVMLAGYLLLLREAAHADGERAQYEADAQALARAREHARARAARRAAAQAATAGEAATAAALAARLAAAPVAADYEDSGQGRDFAPGLAGKYTPSYADPDPADDDYGTYDRAVGD